METNNFINKVKIEHTEIFCFKCNKRVFPGYEIRHVYPGKDCVEEVCPENHWFIQKRCTLHLGRWVEATSYDEKVAEAKRQLDDYVAHLCERCSEFKLCRFYHIKEDGAIYCDNCIPHIINELKNPDE